MHSNDLFSDKELNAIKTTIDSYDNVPEIVDLYQFVKEDKIRQFNISYSASEGRNKKGMEIMFFAPKSIIPECAIC